LSIVVLFIAPLLNIPEAMGKRGSKKKVLDLVAAGSQMTYEKAVQEEARTRRTRLQRRRRRRHRRRDETTTTAATAVAMTTTTMTSIVIDAPVVIPVVMHAFGIKVLRDASVAHRPVIQRLW
jgi:hypothetical protein